jgi:hypothetical protein
MRFAAFAFRASRITSSRSFCSSGGSPCERRDWRAASPRRPPRPPSRMSSFLPATMVHSLEVSTPHSLNLLQYKQLGEIQRHQIRARAPAVARPRNPFPPRCIAQPNRLPRRSVVFLNVLLRPGWRCYLVKFLWVSFVFDVGLAPYESFSTCRSRAWDRRNLLGRSLHGSG